MMKKQPKYQVFTNTKQKPKVNSDMDSFLSKYPQWRFSQCDKEHEKWKIRADELDDVIFEKLQNFERMTWDEILKASGGRSSGNNNHYIEIDKLNKEARKRLEELRIYTDEVFSLRLTGTLRLFGLLESGIFKILWRDDNHEICPSNKKNT